MGRVAGTSPRFGSIRVIGFELSVAPQPRRAGDFAVGVGLTVEARVGVGTTVQVIDTGFAVDIVVAAAPIDVVVSETPEEVVPRTTTRDRVVALAAVDEVERALSVGPPGLEPGTDGL